MSSTAIYDAIIVPLSPITEYPQTEDTMSRILALFLLLSLPCTLYPMGQNGNNSSQGGGEKKNYPPAIPRVITSENPTTERGRINFQDARFELAGKDWQCKKMTNRLTAREASGNTTARH